MSNCLKIICIIFASSALIQCTELEGAPWEGSYTSMSKLKESKHAFTAMEDPVWDESPHEASRHVKARVKPNQQIAVLLPLTGSFSTPARAIKEGIEFGLQPYKNQGITIQWYDTNKEEATSAYQQAVTDGAHYIIGPLLKEEAKRVSMIPHPVPTIVLNETTSGDSNTFQFGLSQRLEAREVAKTLLAKGYRHPLVIAPKGAWGEEIVQSFSDYLSRRDIRPVDLLYYDPKHRLGPDIKEFLAITHSEQRVASLRKIVGYAFESNLQRRQDFDAIFLLAYPSDARQIMPLIKYYYAGDAPVFATSSVYAGSPNARKDKDLDGIVFCDTPFVYEMNVAKEEWPEQWNSYNRLFALGQDSLELLFQLDSLPKGKPKNAIYMTKSQRIIRRPVWGRFEGGIPIKTS